MSNEITIYTTQTCGHCRRLKRQLEEAGVSYREVDINHDPEVALRIEETTGGYRVVPTVEVAGHLLVNPLPADVVAVAAHN